MKQALKQQEVQEVFDSDTVLMTRLAVIESKIETVITELSVIRSYVPGKIVEHTERILALERAMRGMQWIAGAFAVAIIGAFIAHVFTK